MSQENINQVITFSKSFFENGNSPGDVLAKVNSHERFNGLNDSDIENGVVYASVINDKTMGKDLFYEKAFAYGKLIQEGLIE
jgi:hypothetical protein